RAGKKVAFVRISGTIRGRTGGGADVGGTVDGRADIDPATGEVLYCDLTLKADADLPTRAGTLKAIGTLTIQGRRVDIPATAPPPKK
ncbi:MAG TPA: hypothetical protein VH092_14080, partial [Urbifossiella sp.]|nr:hypothetical protein [Urbifossiella sp.]